MGSIHLTTKLRGGVKTKDDRHSAEGGGQPGRPLRGSCQWRGRWRLADHLWKERKGACSCLPLLRPQDVRGQGGGGVRQERGDHLLPCWQRRQGRSCGG